MSMQLHINNNVKPLDFDRQIKQNQIFEISINKQYIVTFNLLRLITWIVWQIVYYMIGIFDKATK